MILVIFYKYYEYSIYHFVFTIFTHSLPVHTVLFSSFGFSTYILSYIKTYLHFSFVCSWSINYLPIQNILIYTLPFTVQKHFYPPYCLRAFSFSTPAQSLLFPFRFSFPSPLFSHSRYILLPLYVTTSRFHNPIQVYNNFTPTSCVFCQKNYNQTFPNFTINFPPQFLTSNFTPALHNTELRIYPFHSAQCYATRSALCYAVATTLRTASLLGPLTPTCQSTTHLTQTAKILEKYF